MNKQQTNSRKRRKNGVDFTMQRRPLLEKARGWLEELLKYANEINRHFASLYQVSKFFGEKHLEIKKQAQLLDKWSFDEAFRKDKPHIIEMFDDNGVDGFRKEVVELMAQIDDIISDIECVTDKIKTLCVRIEDIKMRSAKRQAELLDKYLEHLTEVLSYLWHIEQSPNIRGGAEVSALWRENDKVYSSLLKVYDSLLRKFGKICYENNIRK